jgi:hypothetical protein
METWQKRKDAGGVATPPLGALVNTWPTPDRNMDSGGRTTTGSRDGKQQISLNSTAHGPASPGCLALTEKFVVRLTTLSAWLMGYTGAYLAHWETASSRKRRLKL